MRERADRRRQTPIRAALRADSALQPKIQDGIRALGTRADVLHDGIKQDFGDSLNLDTALRASHPNAHRWDYLLGHAPTRNVIAVEEHSAHTSEVPVIVDKKRAARDQLQGHLRDGRSIARWYWVASGAVQILDLEKARRRLDQHGIVFAGGKLLGRHLL